MTASSGPQARPARVLGTAEAAVVGAAAMLGAGVFAVFAPAAAEAGAWLPVALVVAAGVAFCNVTSTSRLAAAHPESGGAYVWGRERLGELWGYTAGWSFTVGKTASCAVMALTFGAYVLPGWERPLAAAAVVALTAVNLLGMGSTARVATFLLVPVVAVLAGVVAVAVTGGAADSARLEMWGFWPGSFGTLGAAGMLFFAFAGYARVATLVGEVRNPRTTIPRAAALSLGFVLVVYLAVGVAALAVLGPDALAASAAPLADTVAASGRPGLVPVVAAGAALACLGALLTLLPAVSRTVAAMAGDGHLPRGLARSHPRKGAPWAAELAVGAAVLVLVLFFEVGAAIGFSSFGVLAYYTIANASALRLSAAERRPPLLIALGGLGGCVVLALSLPLPIVVTGLAVIAAGAGAWVLSRRLRGSRADR